MRPFKKTRARAELVARWLGSDGIIAFDAAAVWVVVTVLVVAIGFVVLRLHFSSISVWDSFFVEPHTGTKVIAGAPRLIRSDEFMVGTPFILSQLRTGWQAVNPALGAGRTPDLLAVPVADVTLLFQPKFWGFLFLDIERGFSFYWAFRSFGFYLGVFLFFLMVTGGRSALAAVGAGWIVLSAFSQWWFSTSAPEIGMAFTGITISLRYLLFSPIPLRILAGAIGFAGWSFNFILHLYPPFQIPLVLLGVMVVLSWFVSRESWEALRHHRRLRSGFALVGLLLLSTAIFIWARSAWETIQLVGNTVYPGRRIVAGGAMPIWRVFSGLFDFFYTSETRFPAILGNVCEASNYYLLFPVVLFLTLLQRRRDPLLLAVLGYCLFLLGWVTIGYSAWFARLTGLSLVPENRALIGLGWSSILATIRFLAFPGTPRGGNPPWVSALVFLGTMVAFLVLSVTLLSVDPFYTVPRILVAGAVLAVLVLALVSQRPLVLALGLALILIPMVRVNPLARGLGALYGKSVSLVLESEARALPQARWFVAGDVLLPQYMKAQGLHVFNGTLYVPNPADMKKIDPSGRYSHIWNRYAHVIIRPERMLREPAFSLLAPDKYEIRLDLCSEIPGALGITHVVMSRETAVPFAGCLVDTGKSVPQIMGDRRVGIFLIKGPS